MEISFKNWRLPVWLFACLSVVQIAFGQFVLCIEDDGHVSVEISPCVCLSLSGGTTEPVFIGNTDAHQCGPCKDITISIDTVRTASQECLIHHLMPIVITHPEAKIQHFDLAFSKTYLPIPLYHSSLHPSISATILLI